eukprot:1766608-Rhodomonas_salina.3
MIQVPCLRVMPQFKLGPELALSTSICKNSSAFQLASSTSSVSCNQGHAATKVTSLAAQLGILA